MKKFISFISVFLLSFTFLCVSSFASNIKKDVFFLENFDPFSVTVQPLTMNSDYTRTYDDLSRTWICESKGSNFSWSSSNIHIKYLNPDISNGYRMMFKLELRIFANVMFSNPEFTCMLCVNNGTRGPYVNCGSSTYTVSDNFYEVTYNIDYTFTEDVEELNFRFGLYGSNTPLFSRLVVNFPEYVSDFYLDYNDPSLPSYKDPSSTVGKDVNDLKDQEDSLMQDTEQGREDTISLFSGLGDLITELAVPLMAISALFNYFVGGSILNSVLQISLTLGLLGFLFNLGQSLISRSNNKNKRNQKNNNQKNNKNGGG